MAVASRSGHHLDRYEPVISFETANITAVYGIFCYRGRNDLHRIREGGTVVSVKYHKFIGPFSPDCHLEIIITSKGIRWNIIYTPVIDGRGRGSCRRGIAPYSKEIGLQTTGRIYPDHAIGITNDLLFYEGGNFKVRITDNTHVLGIGTSIGCFRNDRIITHRQVVKGIVVVVIRSKYINRNSGII